MAPVGARGFFASSKLHLTILPLNGCMGHWWCERLVRERWPKWIEDFLFGVQQRGVLVTHDHEKCLPARGPAMTVGAIRVNVLVNLPGDCSGPSLPQNSVPHNLWRATLLGTQSARRSLIPKLLWSVAAAYLEASQRRRGKDTNTFEEERRKLRQPLYDTRPLLRRCSLHFAIASLAHHRRIYGGQPSSELIRNIAVDWLFGWLCLSPFFNVEDLGGPASCPNGQYQHWGAPLSPELLSN